VIDVIVVKGADGYNIYEADDAPFTDLRAPTNNGGQIPAISHWFICFHTEEQPPPPETSPNPGASMVQCSGAGGQNGVVVTLTNTGGTAAAAFTVTRNGVTVASPSVPAGGSTQVVVAQTEDEPVTVAATSGAFTLSQTFDSNCVAPQVITQNPTDPGTPAPAQVLGTQLARTGSTTDLLVLLSGAFLLLGGLALGGSELLPSRLRR
jgi:hypothetical protein